MILVVTKCYETFFIALCFDFVSSLLCRGDCFGHWLCVLALCLLVCRELGLYPLWSFLVEIIEILHAVKAGTRGLVLEPRNISLFLRLAISLNSTLIISRIAIIVRPYILDIVLTLVSF